MKLLGITGENINVTSISYQIFCIRQILEKEWECSQTAHQIFINFKKAYVSLRRKELCDIPMAFVVPTKLDSLKCV
jgi:hypothetical protein